MQFRHLNTILDRMFDPQNISVCLLNNDVDLHVKPALLWD